MPLQISTLQSEWDQANYCFVELTYKNISTEQSHCVLYERKIPQYNTTEIECILSITVLYLKVTKNTLMSLQNIWSWQREMGCIICNTTQSKYINYYCLLTFLKQSSFRIKKAHDSWCELDAMHRQYILENCTAMGIMVFRWLLRGNGNRVHGNTTRMGTNFTVVPRGRGPSSR